MIDYDMGSTSTGYKVDEANSVSFFNRTCNFGS